MVFKDVRQGETIKALSVNTEVEGLQHKVFQCEILDREKAAKYVEKKEVN
jgi:hypothetical protein